MTLLANGSSTPLFNTPARYPQTLRGYQREAIDAVLQAWRDGANAPLIVMATGLGKTTVIADLLRQIIDPARERALVIAHTEEIVFQLHNRIANQFAGDLDRFYAGASGIGIVMAERDERDARIVCATRQSLHTSRLDDVLRAGAFKLLVIDEAHHAAARSYRDLVRRCEEAQPNLMILGVTATPGRADGKGLNLIFDKIAYQYPITKAIKAGLLSNVTAVKVRTEIDTRGICGGSDGDFAQDALSSYLEENDWLNIAAAQFVQHVPPERQTLAFLPSVRMSAGFAELLNQLGIAARHIDANTPKPVRRAALEAYQHGAVRVISNVGTLTEGFDAPETSCIFLAAPTRSRARFTQIVGRGLRLHPGKKDCLLIDLTVNDNKVISAADIMGEMVECRACGREYTHGVTNCPHCGALVSVSKRAAAKRKEEAAPIQPQVVLNVEAFLGVHFSAETVSIFEQAASAWVSAPNGVYTISLGDRGSLRIQPQAQRNGDSLIAGYALIHVTKDGEKTLAWNTDVAALMTDAAEPYIEKLGATRLASKTAAWRSEPMTDKQRAMIIKLTGKTPPASTTKGQASQIIAMAMEGR